MSSPDRVQCPRCGDPAASRTECWRCGTPREPAGSWSLDRATTAELHGYGLRNEAIAVELEHHFGWTLHAPGPSDLPGAAYLGALQVSPWLADEDGAHTWAPGGLQRRDAGTIVVHRAGPSGRPSTRPSLDEYWFSSRYRRRFAPGTTARGLSGWDHDQAEHAWVFAELGQREHHSGCTVGTGAWYCTDDPFQYRCDLPGDDWTFGPQDHEAARVALVVESYKMDLHAMREAWVGRRTLRQAWIEADSGRSKWTTFDASQVQRRAAVRLTHYLRAARAGKDDADVAYLSWPEVDAADDVPVEQVWELLGVMPALEAERAIVKTRRTRA